MAKQIINFTELKAHALPGMPMARRIRYPITINSRSRAFTLNSARRVFTLRSGRKALTLPDR